MVDITEYIQQHEQPTLRIFETEMCEKLYQQPLYEPPIIYMKVCGVFFFFFRELSNFIQS